jgi:hypothetical protein
MLQAVAAVAQHKAAEACSRARDEAAAATASAVHQQLQSAHHEAEQKAAKQLAEAQAKASCCGTRTSPLGIMLKMGRLTSTLHTIQ